MSTTFKTLENALNIIEQDIEKIKTMSKNEKTLDKIEAQKLTDYVKVLILVQKEDREQLKSDNLLSKSDADIEELAKQALEFLKQEQESESKETDKEKESEQKSEQPTEQHSEGSKSSNSSKVDESSR